MANYELPTYDQAYDALCITGDPFTGLEDCSKETSLTYQHHSKGERSVAIDPRALSGCDVVFADESLTDLLYEHGAREVAPLDEAIDAMDGYLSSNTTELVWGVSGFATGG
jgi:hypothetical protein